MQPPAAVTITTERLILRPPRAEDFPAWAAFMADAESTHHLGGVQEPPTAWRGFLSAVGGWQIQGFGMFSAIERETGDWVGRVGAVMPLGWPGTEVGWAIVRERWGRGYATEAATAAIDWVVDALGWTEVIHCIGDANAASIRVAERLGSRRLREARLPPPLHIDVVVWGQSADDWRSRRAR